MANNPREQYFECTAVDFDSGNGIGVNQLTNDNPDFAVCANGMTPGLETGVLGKIGTPLDSRDLPILLNPRKLVGYSTQANFDQWWIGGGKTQKFQVTIKLTQNPSTKKWEHRQRDFHPLTGKGFNAGHPGTIASHFAINCYSQFVYTGGESFTFSGDDDVWIYIDRKLAVDLGGLHTPLSKTINVDDFGLVKGCRYPIHLFQADRCSSGSNFNFDTSLTPVREEETGGICPNSQAPGKFCENDNQCIQVNGKSYFCYNDGKTYSKCTLGTSSSGPQTEPLNPNDNGGNDGGSNIRGNVGNNVNGTNTGGNDLNNDLNNGMMEPLVIVIIVLSVLIFVVLCTFFIIWLARRKKHSKFDNLEKSGSSSKTSKKSIELRNINNSSGSKHSRKATYEGWIKHIDNDANRYYYQNEKSGETRWGDPVEEETNVSNPMRQKKSSTPQISNWVEHFDEEHGIPFFHNEKTGETTWERPRTAGGAPLC
jgi:fibro-slime domain-containing protein